MKTLITYTCQRCGGPYQRIKGNPSGKYCSQRCVALVVKPSQHLFIPDGQPMSARTLYRRKKAAGQGMHHEPFNEQFFDTWSDEMAWLLGIIWSDGCLFGNTVEISSQDLQLIELIMAVIEGGTYRLKNRGQHLRVFFTSRHTADRLRSLGLTEHKSMTIQWPAIDPAYEGAFLRGLIDGDGSVLERQERPNQQVADVQVQLVTASQSLQESIADCLSRHDITYTVYVRNPTRPNWNPLWRFTIVQQASLRTLFALLYPDEHVPCLHRKRIPFQLWVQTPRPKTGRIKKQVV